MAPASTYEICRSGACVLEWLSGQPGNNLFTALGALATFLASALALWFSVKETRAQRRTAMAQAQLAAAAALGPLRVTYKRASQTAQILREFRAGNFGDEELLRQLFSHIEHAYPEVNRADLMLLGPLPKRIAVRINSAYGNLKRIVSERVEMQARIGRATDDRPAWVDERVDLLLSLVADLEEAIRVLQATVDS